MSGGVDLGGLERRIGRSLGAGRVGVLFLGMMVLVSAVGLSDATGASAGTSLYSTSDGSDISGENILRTIEDLQDFESRDFHLSSSLEAAQYIYDRFVDMGIETARQDFEVGGLPSTNIIATVDGGAGEAVVVLGAHYDSENSLATDISDSENMTAPGADDNASGIAVMLEIARNIAAGNPLASTVKFVAFGAEESGFDHSGSTVGSMHYAISESQADTDIVAGVVLDMVGYKLSDQDRLTIVSNSANDEFLQTSSSVLAGSDADLELEVMVNADITYSDHHSFWLEGYPCALLTEELDDGLVPVNPFYHTSWDTADTLSVSQMTAAGELLLEATQGIAGSLGNPSDPVPTIVLAAVGAAAGVVVILVIANWRCRK